MFPELIQRVAKRGSNLFRKTGHERSTEVPVNESPSSSSRELGAPIRIENVVASTAIDQKIDAEAVSEDLSHSEFDPETHPAIIYRPPSIASTLMLFPSGKVVLTGAKRIESVEPAVTHLFDELRKLGIHVPVVPEITIQNVVCNTDLGQDLQLDLIAISFGLEQVEYEPEQFPGLIYRLQEPAVVLLAFASGNVVVAGGKSLDDAEQAITTFTDRLSEFDLLGEATVRSKQPA